MTVTDGDFLVNAGATQTVFLDGHDGVAGGAQLFLMNASGAATFEADADNGGTGNALLALRRSAGGNTFFFDAGTFAVAAGLVFLISGDFRTHEPGDLPEKIDWVGEIKEGWDWLWHHPLLRPMAIILGFMNGLMSVTMATFRFC